MKPFIFGTQITGTTLICKCNIQSWYAQKSKWQINCTCKTHFHWTFLPVWKTDCIYTDFREETLKLGLFLINYFLNIDLSKRQVRFIICLSTTQNHLSGASKQCVCHTLYNIWHIKTVKAQYPLYSWNPRSHYFDAFVRVEYVRLVSFCIMEWQQQAWTVMLQSPCSHVYLADQKQSGVLCLQIKTQKVTWVLQSCSSLLRKIVGLTILQGHTCHLVLFTQCSTNVCACTFIIFGGSVSTNLQQLVEQEHFFSSPGIL